MFFEQMIKICSASGGDVVKFAGDALIVVWIGAPPKVFAVRACECAMELQESLHKATMANGVEFSLKVGVGMGSLTIFYVGGHAGRCE